MMRPRRPIRARNWCAACRSTNASSALPRASIGCRGWIAIPGSRRPIWSIARWCACRRSVTLQEMLIAFQDVLSRSDMFAHHHVQREPLSVRQRMADVLSSLTDQRLRRFRALVHPGRGPPRGHGDLRGHPGTVARRVDRNSAIGSIRAAACAPGQSGPAPETGRRRRRRQR